MDSEDKNTPDEDEVLKTFDMYRCFSRWDVILAILFVLGAVLLLFYLFFSGDQVV